MSDLGRLIDDPGEDRFLRDALDSARDDLPDAARRAATLSALSPDAIAKPAKNTNVNVTVPPPPDGADAASGATTGSAGNVAATPAAAGGAALKWVAIIGLLAGAVAVGVYGMSGETSGTPATNTGTTQPSFIVPGARVVPSAAVQTAPETSRTQDTILPSAEAPKVDTPPKGSAAPEARASAAPAKAAPLGLAEETAMLDRARTALTRGDARGALAELDRYDAAPAPKILGQEATMVRIEALSAKGDTAGARTLAKSFLAKNPGSTYDDRVRALIAEPKQPEPKTP